MKLDARFPVVLKAIRRPLLVLTWSAAMAVSLQGCFPVMVGGTVMGTMSATDRRSLGAQTDDAAIVLKAEGRALKITGDQGRVSVNSFNRHVLITGEVKDEKMKKEVEKEIKVQATAVAKKEEIEITMREFDKISQALPPVDGLGQAADAELDNLANKAEKAYDDLMDLGMNVESKYSARIFEVAGGMLKNAIDAKVAKLDKKSSKNISVNEQHLKQNVAIVNKNRMK